MSILDANQLLAKIENNKDFPPRDEYQLRKNLQLYSALRESDAAYLKPNWWKTDHQDRQDEDYIIDSLGERIPQVWADMLFGEEPEFEPALKADRQRLEEAVDYNDLPSELHFAEEICSSEGEVWWRQVSVPADGHVRLEWHSREQVVPLWRGHRLAAAAFFSILEYDQDTQKFWTYVEVHAEGVILNRLYHHSAGAKLGDPKDLGERPETEMLRANWGHPLEILCGRIRNRHSKNFQVGKSDYKGVASLLLALNEVQNIGQENVRLTAKQKVIIPERFLNARGQLPRGAEIIIATEVDADPTKIKNDLAQVEWEFDAAALLAYKEDIVNTVLTRARIAPQLVGRGMEGAVTGPSLRARLMDSIMASDGKAKPWDDQVPKILALLAKFEGIPLGAGGPGNRWRSEEPVVFKRRSALPEDETDRSNRTVTEVNAKILSKQTAIENNNPTWGPDRVAEEMDRLQEEADAELKRMQEQFNSRQLDDGGKGEINLNNTTQPNTSGSDGKQDIPDPARAQTTRRGKARATSVPDSQRTANKR